MPQFDTIQPVIATTDTLTDTLNVATTDSLAEMPHIDCILDSLFVPMDSVPAPVVRKSLFTHHQLAVQNSHETMIHHQASPGWLLGFIILSLCTICLFLRSKQIHIIDLLTSAIDHRAMDRMLRDTNMTHATDQAPIALIMLLPTTLIGYYCIDTHISSTWLNILQYLGVYACACGIYFLRNGLIRLIGVAFNNPDSVHLYLSNNYVFHLLYAIVAAAMAFFVFYTSTAGRIFLFIAIGIIGLLFTIRLLRGMQLILTNSKTSKLYLFYYLCILEIIPIIVIAKVIMSY